MTTPDHIMPPPLQDTGPLETMARAFHNADAQHFAIAYAGPIPDYYTARAQAAIDALTEAGYAIVRDDDLRMANGALATHGLSPLTAIDTKEGE